MKLSCEVIGDLLPLYAERLTSAESAALVEEHLAGCPDCRERLAALSQPAPARAEEGAEALRAVKKGIRRRRWQTALLAALLVFLPLFALLARGMEQYPLPYEPELVRVESTEGGVLTLSFDARVTGVESELCEEPESGERILLVQAWSNRLREQRGAVAGRGSCTVSMLPDCVIYGFGSEQTLIYGEPMNGGMQILPRLALGYYLLVSLAVAAVAGLLWLIFRKKKAADLLRALFFAALSYPIGHLLVKGTQTLSFHLLRDLAFILGAAAAVWGLLTLGWIILRQKKRENA